MTWQLKQIRNVCNLQTTPNFMPYAKSELLETAACAIQNYTPFRDEQRAILIKSDKQLRCGEAHTQMRVNLGL